jgi:hypothetical protein
MLAGSTENTLIFLCVRANTHTHTHRETRTHIHMNTSVHTQDKVPHQDARSMLYESDLHLDAVGEHPRCVCVCVFVSIVRQREKSSHKEVLLAHF